MPDSKEPSEFGRWLIEARGRANLTQDELAEACGYYETEDGELRHNVHANTIKNIESGRVQRPTARVVEKLKDALGTTPDSDQAYRALDETTKAFLQMAGAYLMRLPAEQRLARVFELTRHILSDTK